MMLAFFLVNFNFWHVRAQVRAFDDLDHLAVFWDLLFHRFIVYGASQNLSFFNLIIFWVVSEQFRHHTEVIFRINLHFVGILRILWHWERGKLFEMLKIGGCLWHWARKRVLHLLELQIGKIGFLKFGKECIWYFTLIAISHNEHDSLSQLFSVLRAFVLCFYTEIVGNLLLDSLRISAIKLSFDHIEDIMSLEIGRGKTIIHCLWKHLIL